MSKKKSLVLRSIFSYLNQFVKMSYSENNSIYISEKRLILILEDEHIVKCIYRTVDPKNSCKFNTHIHFEMDIANPESFNIMKDKIIKFKHPSF